MLLSRCSHLQSQQLAAECAWSNSKRIPAHRVVYEYFQSLGVYIDIIGAEFWAWGLRSQLTHLLSTVHSTFLAGSCTISMYISIPRK